MGWCAFEAPGRAAVRSGCGHAGHVCWCLWPPCVRRHRRAARVVLVCTTTAQLTWCGVAGLVSLACTVGLGISHGYSIKWLMITAGMRGVPLGCFLPLATILCAVKILVHLRRRKQLSAQPPALPPTSATGYEAMPVWCLPPLSASSRRVDVLFRPCHGEDTRLRG